MLGDSSPAPPDPVRPDYGGAWVGGIVPALVGDGDGSWLPEPVSGADGVVLLVIDGLGWSMIDAHAEALPTLRAMTGRSISSVVPSTTAAALTSIATGAAPCDHGLVGYRIRVGGEPLNVLRWSVDKGPDPAATQPVAPFGGCDVPVVTRAEFRKSGFTIAHLRGASLIGWKTTSTLVEHIRGLSESRRRLVYAYYDGVDKVAHEYGLRNAFLPAELRAADRLVADVLAALPPSWALLVTADHGQVHVDAGDVVTLDDVAGRVAAYAGEGRFRTLFARRGEADALLRDCAALYGDRAWVLSREQLFDEGWLGPGGGLTVRGRIGDVVLAPHAPVMFVDPGYTREAKMRSHHGSMTAAEVEVPLLAARG